MSAAEAAVGQTLGLLATLASACCTTFSCSGLRYCWGGCWAWVCGLLPRCSTAIELLDSRSARLLMLHDSEEVVSAQPSQISCKKDVRYEY